MCSSIEHSPGSHGHIVAPWAVTAALFTQCFSNFIQIKAPAQESY